MAIQHTGRPNADHAPAYGKYYLDQTAGETDLLLALDKNMNDFCAFIDQLPADKADYRYADDKWTVKGVLAHCIDTERVFQYRAFRFSRKDETPLSGFDEDWYGKYGGSDQRSYQDIKEEFIAVRKSTNALFQQMSAEMLDFLGPANAAHVSPRSLGWMTIGHTIHHMNIIKVRYLVVDDEML